MLKERENNYEQYDREDCARNLSNEVRNQNPENRSTTTKESQLGDESVVTIIIGE